MRLIDRLRASSGVVHAPAFVPENKMAAWAEMAKIVMRAVLDEAELPVIDGNPMAEYFFSCEQEYWNVERDFPNLTPPHRIFWCEYRPPKKVHSRECGDMEFPSVGGLPPPLIGVLVTALDPKDVKAEEGREIPPEVRSILWCELFIDYGQPDIAAVGPHGAIFVAVDAAGKALGPPWIQTFCGEEYFGIVKGYLMLIYPALLAISFKGFEVKA